MQQPKGLNKRPDKVVQGRWCSFRVTRNDKSIQICPNSRRIFFCDWKQEEKKEIKISVTCAGRGSTRADAVTVRPLSSSWFRWLSVDTKSISSTTNKKNINNMKNISFDPVGLLKILFTNKKSIAWRTLLSRTSSNESKDTNKIREKQRTIPYLCFSGWERHPKGSMYEDD